MNLRTTLILFGLLVVGLGAFGLFQLLNVKTAQQRERTSRYLFASLNDPNQPVAARDFTRLIIERENPETKGREKLEFAQEGGQWKMLGPQSVRIDDAIVSGFVNQIMSLQKEGGKLKESLASYGLDKPSATITLIKDKEPKEHKLFVGRMGPEADDPFYFVATSDDPTAPATALKSRMDKLFAPLADFRDKRIFTSSFGITGLTLAGKERPKVELSKQGETHWRFKEPAYGDADAASVNNATSDLTGLRIEKNGDFIHDGKLDAELLKKYGLAPDDAAYAVTIVQPAVGDAGKQLIETLLIGAIDPSAKAAGDALRAAALLAALAARGSHVQPLGPVAAFLHGPAAPDVGVAARYAMKVGADGVFRLSEKHLPLFTKTANEFRAKTVVSLDATKLDAIDLKAGGETLRLRRQTLKADASAPAEWLLFTEARGQVPAQNSQVQKLIDALNRVAVKDASAFLDDDEAQRQWFGAEPINLGLDKPGAELAIWLEGLERGADGTLAADKEPAFKAAAKDKPHVRIFMGHRDPKRGVVYVRRETADEKPVTLALPDPWQAQAPPPSFPGAPPTQTGQSYSLSDIAGAGYLAFRDHSLPSPRIMDVARFEVHRPSGNLELVKSETKDESGFNIGKWEIKKPIEAPSPLADMILNGLISTAADKLVADQPTPQELEEKYGLGATPLMKFTLHGKPDANQKAAVYTYVVGKPTPADGKHPGHYYGRLIAQPADGKEPQSNQFVFLFTQPQVQLFDQELRDTSIFAHETALKPQSLTLTWRGVDMAKKLTETRLELGLAEDKKTWVVKALTIDGKDEKARLPKLDQAKIERFVGAGAQPFGGAGPKLNPLATERFIVHAGGPTPAMHLDPASKEAPAPLEIDLGLEGGARRGLTIGAGFEPKEADAPALAGRAFYHAAASSVPGAVFLVSQADFKDLLAGFTYFAPPEKVAIDF